MQRPVGSLVATPNVGSANPMPRHFDFAGASFAGAHITFAVNEPPPRPALPTPLGGRPSPAELLKWTYPTDPP